MHPIAVPKPAPPAIPERTLPDEKDDPSHRLTALLRLLCEAAEAGRPCPILTTVRPN